MFRNYNPAGSKDGHGMFAQIESRCTEEQQQTAYDPDRITYAHEMTHQLNSALRNKVGQASNAFFVGSDKGWWVSLKEPKVTLSQVAELVHKEYRNEAYELYLKDQQKYWNDQPLYVLDELSAYINGSTVAIEEGLPDHGSHDRAKWFGHYAACVVLACHKYDPTYPQLKELQEFVIWQNGRINQMFSDLSQIA